MKKAFLIALLFYSVFGQAQGVLLHGVNKGLWVKTGNLGIGVTTPAARLHIQAGTATSNTAPLKLTAGTNLTSPEDGAIEFDGTHFYATVGSTRYQLDQQSTGSSYTFSNGLTESGGTVGIGGTLTNSPTIDGGGSYTPIFTGGRATANSSLIAENTSSGRGITGTSNTGTGVYGSGSIGVLGISSSGYGLWGQSSTGQGLYVQSPSTSGAANITANPTSTNAVHTIANLTRVSTSAGADGIGGTIDFNLNNTTAAGSVTTATRLISKLTTATAGAEVSQFEVWGVNGGSIARKFSVAGSGQVTADGYGSGTITGTASKLAGFTSGGNLIELPLNGSFGSIVIVNDADHTVASNESAIRYVNAVTADRDVTLPSAASNPQREIWVRWGVLNGGVSMHIESVSDIYTDGTSGSTSQPANVSHTSMLFKSDGTSWYKVN